VLLLLAERPFAWPPAAGLGTLLSSLLAASSSSNSGTTIITTAHCSLLTAHSHGCPPASNTRRRTGRSSAMPSSSPSSSLARVAGAGWHGSRPSWHVACKASETASLRRPRRSRRAEFSPTAPVSVVPSPRDTSEPPALLASAGGALGLVALVSLALLSRSLRGFSNAQHAHLPVRCRPAQLSA